MTAEAFAWVADALIIGGLALMTLAVVGVIRLPDVYTKLHAGSKATSVAIVLLSLATVVTGEPAVYLRALLGAVFVLLTAQVAAYAIARAAAARGEPLASEERVDESGLELAPDGEVEPPL